MLAARTTNVADRRCCTMLHTGLVIVNSVVFLSLKHLNPSGRCTVRTASCCNMQQFYVLPTQCVYVFCVDLRTNSDCFPIQH
jgi:hypothetical protein